MIRLMFIYLDLKHIEWMLRSSDEWRGRGGLSLSSIEIKLHMFFSLPASPQMKKIVVSGVRNNWTAVYEVNTVAQATVRAFG